MSKITEVAAAVLLRTGESGELSWCFSSVCRCDVQRLKVAGRDQQAAGQGFRGGEGETTLRQRPSHYLGERTLGHLLLLFGQATSPQGDRLANVVDRGHQGHHDSGRHHDPGRPL